MSLEDIEKELYGQKEKTVESDVKKPEEKKSPEAKRIQNPWRNEETINREPEQVKKIEKIGSKVFVILSVLLIGLLGFAGFYLYQYFTTKDARFSLSGPTEVRVGEPFVVNAVFQNVSKKSLFEPMITIRLPEGMIYADDPDKRILSELIPNSTPGDSTKREYSFMVTGKAYQTYELEAEISYRYEASSFSSRFEKGATFAAVARNPVLSVDLMSPDSVMQGQDFEMQVSYKNETENSLEHVRIGLELPANFSMNNSDPVLEKNGLVIEKLAAHEEGTITFSGFVADDVDAFVKIGAHAFIQKSQKEYEIASKINSLSIAASPLSVRLEPERGDGEDNHVVLPGEFVKMRMRVQNNASIALREIVASIKFVGDGFDLSTLSGSGTLQDRERSYTWTAGNVARLKSLDPGQEIEIPFSLKIKSGYAKKDADMHMVGMAVSADVPPGVTAQKTIGMTTYEIKIGGKLALEQTLYFNEPTSDIKNEGNMPPTIGNETTFTIHWKLRSWGADAKNIRVKATLGRSMKWTGKVVVKNTADVPAYNANTDEITWNVGSASAKSGEEPEVIFQVAFVPASNMGGTTYVFLENISYDGEDSFTASKLSGKIDSLDSRDFADAGALPFGYDEVKE